MEILRETNPVARKEHKCMFCNDTIEKGQRYNRQTIASDGIVYDWICHEECIEITSLLDMEDASMDDGINGDDFRDCVDEYVYENHYDKETDDIAEEWQVSLYELVKMIIEELKNRNE